MSLAKTLTDAMEFARRGERARASGLLQSVLKTDPDQPDALQLLGMIARQSGDSEGAAALYRRSLRANPTQPHVQNNLGNALLALGRRGEAIEAYCAALALMPDYGDARTNLGIAYLASGRAEKAREALEQAIQLDADNAKAWLALGQALRALERLPEAVKALVTAAALRPQHVPTLHNLAVALRLSGEAARAAPLLEKCAKAQSRTPEIHYNLGHCYYDLGRLDEAAAAYAAAVSADPLHRDAHDALNRLYWERGMTEHYLQSYRVVLEAYPEAAELLIDYCTKLNFAGGTRTAMDALGDAQARGLQHPGMAHRLGQALCAEGRPQEGLEQFRLAVRQDPSVAEFRLDLARTLILLERYEEVSSVLEPVLERSPFDQQAIAYQALAWGFLGDSRAEAINDYDRFVRDFVLPPPTGYNSIEAFNRKLESVLQELHHTSQHPLEQTLRGGTQTMGNIFDRREPEIIAIQEMIEAAVARYIDALPYDPDHIFLKRKTSDFRFSGSWSVRLRTHGYHLNHVHSAGWISSAYYVALPKSDSSHESEEGWLKFGETSLLLGARERIAKFVKPEVGKLVLFPSYLYHGTVPFSADAYRTTIAFDVIPA